MSIFLDLNKYIKQDEIGHGAFGEVYKARQKGTENILAAKISFTKLNKNDTELFTELKHEVSILSQLNHPSILKFIGYSPFDFDQNAYPVIITEYSPNGSLRDIINLDRKHAAPRIWTDTKKLINIYGIASAMSYLHSNNIIHRDLKPENILEDENLFPKIADFGLSKSYNKSSSKTKKEIKGTKIYIAPEIWHEGEYSKAGDVYAFAIIVYEILTLDTPFQNYNHFSFLSEIIMNDKRPTFFYPIPLFYRDFIKKCWSTDPNHRPSFNEIVTEMRTNKGFIIDSINEKEYFDYIDFIDKSKRSFGKSKKLTNLLSSQDNNNQNSIENINEPVMRKISEEEIENDLKDETKANCEEECEEQINKTITVGTFNNLSLEMQQINIRKIIEKEKNKETIEIYQGINQVLEYLITKEVTAKEGYLYIPSKTTDISIVKYFQTKSKIAISSKAISTIGENINTNMNKIIEYLSKIEQIIIEIEYPSKNFDNICETIIAMKEKYEGQVLIRILINHIKQTDMKFQYSNFIYSIAILDEVCKISGTSSEEEKEYVGGSFAGCKSLKQISIGKSVSFIGSYSFWRCRSLTKIVLPSSLISIEEGAFMECSSLTQISIPSSVTSIGKSAFEKCSSLAQIEISSSVTEIEQSVFKKCSSLTQITIPSSVIKIGDNAFNGCSSLTQITIPSSVTCIGNYAFDGCSTLMQITIPSSVTSIGNYAFSGCSSLTQITIPSSVTKIGDYAFSGCSSLTQISIPSSVTSIGYNIFSRCSSLTQRFL